MIIYNKLGMKSCSHGFIESLLWGLLATFISQTRKLEAET